MGNVDTKEKPAIEYRIVGNNNINDHEDKSVIDRNRIRIWFQNRFPEYAFGNVATHARECVRILIVTCTRGDRAGFRNIIVDSEFATAYHNLKLIILLDNRVPIQIDYLPVGCAIIAYRVSQSHEKLDLILEHLSIIFEDLNTPFNDIPKKCQDASFWLSMKNPKQVVGFKVETFESQRSNPARLSHRAMKLFQLLYVVLQDLAHRLHPIAITPGEPLTNDLIVYTLYDISRLIALSFNLDMIGDFSHLRRNLLECCYDIFSLDCHYRFHFEEEEIRNLAMFFTSEISSKFMLCTLNQFVRWIRMREEENPPYSQLHSQMNMKLKLSAYSTVDDTIDIACIVKGLPTFEYYYGAPALLFPS